MHRDFKSEKAGGKFDFAHILCRVWAPAIAHGRQSSNAGNDLAQEFDPFARKIGLLDGKSGSVARPAEQDWQRDRSRAALRYRLRFPPRQ